MYALTTQTIKARLFNVTTNLEITDSLFKALSATAITGNIGGYFTKQLIIENLTSNTNIILQVIADNGGTSYINNGTDGRTGLSYKMLGVTANVMSNEMMNLYALKSELTNLYALKTELNNYVRRWKSAGSSFTIAFDLFELYLLSYNDLRLRKTNGSSSSVCGSATNTFNGANVMNFEYSIGTTFSSYFVISPSNMWFTTSARTCIIHFNDSSNLYKIVISMWSTSYFVISISKL